MVKLKAFATAFLPRIATPSGVAGALGIACLAFGVTVAPERIDAIATVVASVASIGLVVVKEA